MIGNELQNFYSLLYKKKYYITHIEFKLIKNIGEVGIVVLENKSRTDKKIITSSQNDFLKVISQFFPSVDIDGEDLYLKYQSEDRYYGDVKFFEDALKRGESFEKVASGQYTPIPKLDEKIKEFLFSKNRFSSDYKFLKTGYYEYTCFFIGNGTVYQTGSRTSK
jgi:hypothetical protein